MKNNETENCGTCTACEIERIGCACDGAVDAGGCFACDPARYVRPACPPPPGRQARTSAWVNSTFGEEAAWNVPERALRAAEEALELAQACDVDAATIHELVDYVFGRQKGTAAQEIGGCMLTIYAVAAAIGADADEQIETELARVQQPEVIERCQRRQKEKRERFGVSEPAVEVLGDPRSVQRWTVVGLYERGKYIRNVFVCYIGGVTAEEAKDTAVRTNAERGDKIEVLACVAGGGVAHAFDPEVPTRSRTLRSDAAKSKNTIIDQRNALWQLLDDIDTLDDAAREHDDAFRDGARRIQKKRWEIYNPDPEPTGAPLGRVPVAEDSF